MRKERFLRLFIIFSILIGLISSNTMSVYADNDDNKWYLDVRDEVQLPNKEWSIVFTTEVDKKTVNDKNIYVLNSKNRKVDNIQIKYTEGDNTLKVTPVKEYEQGETYFLCLDEGLKSYQGEPLSTPYKLQFKIKRVDSDFFKIRNIDVVSKNRLDVYFTQPINKEAELPLYYEILLNGYNFLRGSYQTMDVKKIDGCDNGVSLYLKEKTLTSYDQYTLNIIGDLMSDYNVRLNNGTGDTINFYGVDGENKALEVTDVETISDTLVRVNFNEPFDRNSAEQKKNYLLQDSSGTPKSITKISLSADSKTVELSLYPRLKKDEEYDLTIKGIEDKFNLTELKRVNHNVYWYDGSNSDIEVTSFEVVNRRVINVYFNKELDKNLAVRTSYYQIKDNATKRLHTTPLKVYYNPDKNPEMVTLYLKNDVIEERIYSLVVSRYLKDNMGNTSYSDSKYEFEGSYIKYEGSYVQSAVIIGNDHIKVNFTGQIMNSGKNIEKSNYTLVCNQGENRKIIIECSNVRYVDDKTIVLSFEGLNFNEDYVLKINSLTDCLGKTTDIYSDGIDVIYRD